MEIKFKLLSNTEKLIAYMNRWIPNFPKKEVVLRRNIEQNEYELIECVFGYNIQQSARIKEKYLKDYLIKLSMFDFYVRQCYHKRYISKHQLESLTSVLIDCRKLAYGLIRSDGDVR